jgi:hypothetical protein
MKLYNAVTSILMIHINRGVLNLDHIGSNKQAPKSSKQMKNWPGSMTDLITRIIGRANSQ